MQEMQGTQIQSLGWEDHLEEEMTIHSSILAWEMTEEPGGLYIVHGVMKSPIQLSMHTFILNKRKH